MNIIKKIDSWFKAAQAVDSEETGNAGPTTIAGNPSSFQVITLYPSIIKGWGSENLNNIQQLVTDLNQALYVMSEAQLDLNDLRVSTFNVDSSKYPSSAVMALVRLSQLIYSKMLTNGGQVFKTGLTPEDKRGRLTQIINYINSSNLGSTTKNQFLQSRIGGNLKEKLLSIVQAIK
jgi:hypothetical protein